MADDSSLAPIIPFLQRAGRANHPSFQPKRLEDSPPSPPPPARTLWTPPHEHISEDAPEVCIDFLAWEFVKRSLKVKWCGTMRDAPFNLPTGQLLGREGSHPYRCHDATCQNCNYRLSCRFLNSIPEIWPEDASYYLLSPTNRHWAKNWSNFVEHTIMKIEYIQLTRLDPRTKDKQTFLWASHEILDYAERNADTPWKKFDFKLAWRELRDQMCVPFLGRSPTNKASGNWQLKRDRFIRRQKGWQSKVVDPTVYDAHFEQECRDWEGRTGVNPMSGRNLPSPQEWLDHLTEQKIILSDAKGV